MASEKLRFAIRNKSSILFLSVFSLFCCKVSGLDVKQSFQTSIAVNLSESDVESEIHSQSSLKSNIEISDPEQGTVWTVSQPAKIQWKTENIDMSKSIRFFLAKDDMVVQELGSFKNNSLAEGIELARNVGSGDQYQVVGIELFPDNKFQVAKYATSYFSIRNPEADARKAAALAKRGNPEKPDRKAKGRNNIPIAKKENPAETNATAETVEEFQGRKISYVKELSFANEEISVSLWDHGRQDGDIVSIYLNGETVVSKHYLTYRRKKVSFTLDASKSNDLFLYAHNLGKAPPNTVSIELTDGSTSEKIILNSDLKSCEAVQIKVE